MNYIESIREKITSETAFHMAGGVALAAVCGYGGTFFFSLLNPAIGAAYVASAAITSMVAYQALESLKDNFKSERVKKVITIVQLLQIPLSFYLLPEPLGLCIRAATKLEIIIATAHFAAIPVFFHLAIEAYRNPTTQNIALAAGVMLPLATGMRTYVALFV